MDTQQTDLSLRQATGVLRRRAPWILLCLVLVTGAAYAVSKRQTKQYTATASLVFSNNEPTQQVAGLQSAIPNQATNVKLVQLGDMGVKTARRLGHSATVSVSAEGESNIVDVSATATSPVLAREFANTYTRLFVKEQQTLNRKGYTSAAALVKKQLAALSPKERVGAAGLALLTRAASLGALAELQPGGVQVAQAASLPTAPSSPHIAKNTLLGAVLGLILGFGVAFLLEHLDRRIREPKDLAAIYHLPLLGVIPESSALAHSTNSSRSARRRARAKGALPPADEEAFHLIRAHLRYLYADRELRTLLVASAAAGDGKTTLARQLASAAAGAGSVVLLVEADLRRPTLAQQLEIQPGPGLLDVLTGTVSLWRATQMIDLDSSPGDGSDGRTFDVLVAGAELPPNPGELIDSDAMRSVLEQARSTYDLIVVDTPPLGAISDAFPLLRGVDGVIIVGRLGRHRREVAEDLHDTLAGAGAPLLGVVANGVKSTPRGSDDYARARAYAGAKRPPAPLVSANGASASGAAPNGASPSGDASLHGAALTRKA